MTLADLTSKIEPLHNEMRDITLAAGVPETQYNKIVEVDAQTVTLEEMSERLLFLQVVRAEQYQKVLEIWRLLKPEIWDRYVQYGETNLREQRLLRETRKNLKRIWRQKYGETKQQAVNEEHQGNADAECLRSA